MLLLFNFNHEMCAFLNYPLSISFILELLPYQFHFGNFRPTVLLTANKS